MAIRRKRKETDATGPLVADQRQAQKQNERDESLDHPPCADAADVPGQPEPSAEAEGECQPELDEARARRLAQ